MDINSALQKLFSLHQFGIKLGLESINNLLAELGSPHKKLKTFHIAGSNGKGSTSSFIASILMEAGFKVGLYTSPHFVKYNERIRINGAMIDDDYVAKYISSLNPYIDKHEPTFFEITTALAFKYFEEQQVDYAVIETGLGGRLDATNVLNPISSIITSISLEHTQHLGDTIEKIASEKAGIVKPDTPVFIGRLPNDAEKIIAETCRRNNCRYFRLKDFTIENSDRILVSLVKNSYSIYTTALRGGYQKYNAALAIKMINECMNIDDGLLIDRALKNVVKNTGIQGRYEVVNDSPRIIMDSAHNPESLRLFIDEFQKERFTYSEVTLLFGVMKDKALREMFELLKNNFDEIYITKVDIERSAGIKELKEIASSVGLDAKVADDPCDFVSRFRQQDGAKCLVVLGSMYLLGEIKSKNL